jgi:surfactin synthase thioesterase subunit
MRVDKHFPFRRSVPSPRVRLACFPYAGGSAALYRRWPHLADPAIDVWPIELPGRGLRLDEPLAHDMMTLCDQLAAALEPRCVDAPLALFGHSMGARLAFEVARRLDARTVHLFASGSPAPNSWPLLGGPDRRRPTAELTDAEFLQRLGDLRGTPPELLSDHAVMRKALPIVRADFQLVEAYRPDPEARVACPITVFAGAQDLEASRSHVAAWQQRTSATLRIVEVDAGHFFLESHCMLLLQEIARALMP